MKGTHFYDAFQQLAATLQLPEFTEIATLFKADDRVQFSVYPVVVSSAMLNPTDHQRLEKTHSIRVRKVLQSSPNTTVEDIRRFL